MANLQETAQWETGIYQLETSDPVMGGADGIDNRQAKQLGNRTLWLKNEMEQMAREIPAAVTKSDAVNSNSSDTVATSKAVKTAYDKAAAAERLANGKAAAGHKHTVADVQGLQQDLDALLGKLLPVSDKIGGFYIVKFPDGTMIQTYSVNIGDNRGSQGYEEHQFTWAVAFVSRPAVSYAVRSNAANAHYAFWVGESHDATGSLHKFRVIEGIRILQDATVVLTAIGRWK